ncbi:hypothetical protein FH972_021792 [Carpinus fangiana]|uniref:Uncharacterized protein n=1 Tax=Carpinus fangiana TaxID=176857 RepID=A0A5N6KQQ1_9ROSI|nr:hypothetical protein FH972_021792 [Carpinus fangiana]
MFLSCSVSCSKAHKEIHQFTPDNSTPSQSDVASAEVVHAVENPSMVTGAMEAASRTERAADGPRIQELETLLVEHPQLKDQLKEIYEISRRQASRQSERGRRSRGPYRARSSRPGNDRDLQPSGDAEALLLVRALKEQAEGSDAGSFQAFADAILSRPPP